ncbi:MAG: hypothetical protein F6J95_021645 [Leptolyngbya sp. SIO1E4]|nr:hypothetical protein [Leptolyngbya sp. SIO1E4]
MSVSKLEYWEKTFRHEICLGAYARPKLFSLRSRRLLIPWLDYCNEDGYRRERALRSSHEGVPNGFLFALVLRRLNDWVPQVRAAAREHLPKMAANTKPEHILEALWVILPHLHSWGRLQVEDLEVLMNLLSVDGVPSQLESKLIEVTAGPAALILGQAGRKPVLDKFLPTISEKAVQPAVRAKAYRSQLEERIVWFEGRKWVWTDIRWCQGRYEPVLGERKIRVYRAFFETLEKAARDDSPVVRRVAGNALMAKLNSVGADALPIAELLSRDPYPSVAERGKFALERLKA